MCFEIYILVRQQPNEIRIRKGCDDFVEQYRFSVMVSDADPAVGLRFNLLGFAVEQDRNMLLFKHFLDLLETG